MSSFFILVCSRTENLLELWLPEVTELSALEYFGFHFTSLQRQVGSNCGYSGASCFESESFLLPRQSTVSESTLLRASELEEPLLKLYSSRLSASDPSLFSGVAGRSQVNARAPSFAALRSEDCRTGYLTIRCNVFGSAVCCSLRNRSLKKFAIPSCLEKVDY